MPETLNPLSSVSFGETPVNGALSMLEVVFILPLIIVASLLPIELSNPMHTAINPIPLIDLPIEPGILSGPMELVLNEISSVVSRKFSLADVLKYEI